MPESRPTPSDPVPRRSRLIALLAVTLGVGIGIGAAGGVLIARLSAPKPPNFGPLPPPYIGDPILTRTFNVSPPPPGGSFQYRWRRATGSPSPWFSAPPFRTSAGSPQWQIRVDFRNTNPKQQWTLDVASVDANGVSQTVSRDITTPLAPLFIALGDSVAAGYHKLSSDAQEVCNDGAFSYAGHAAQAFYSSLPAAWRVPGPGTWSGNGGNGYWNLARSGYGTGPGGNAVGSIIGGGPDTCSHTPDTPPLAQARGLLLKNTTSKNAASWNQVVITAGVNDTNWAAADGPIPKAVDAVVPDTCRGAVEQWSGYDPGVLTGITQRVNAIYRGLTDAQNGVAIGADIHWVGYYDISKTFPLLNPDCVEPIEDALTLLNSAIQSGLPPGDVDWVPANDVMHQNSSLMQNLVGLGPNWVPEQQGWPHPNSSGSCAIAKLFAKYWNAPTPC